MTPEVDAIARDAVSLAHGFGDKMSFARIKDMDPAERQAAAAKAMLCLALFEEKAEELKRLMPRSTAEGVDLRKDLGEIAG